MISDGFFFTAKDGPYSNMHLLVLSFLKVRSRAFSPSFNHCAIEIQKNN